MDEKPQNTNEPEVIEAQPQEPSLGEALQGNKPNEEPKLETVGLDKFLDIKKQNKELKKSLEELQKNIEKGSSDSIVSADIDSIADEYGVDKGFLNKLKTSMREEFSAELEERVSEKLKPIEQAELQKEEDKKFNTLYSQSLERMPEYANIIDKEGLKILALSGKYKDISLPQLIEQLYGKTIVGRKSIETTTPRGGKDPQEIDFALAKKDATYFKEIMSDPNLKAKYNSNIESRLNL